jgi:uncharacterized membrane protein
MVSRPDRLTNDLIAELRGAVDIGPTRTLQQDVEFGISRTLIRWIRRAPPSSHMYDPPHVLRVVLPWIGFEVLLNTAFEQIRHYGAGDVAVSLRLLRAYADIAGTVREPALRDVLRRRAQAVIAGCEGRLPESDMARLRDRAALVADFAG